jgi:uncharacterized membrane protein/mono/diheme cytochrome c family protein
MQPRDLPRSTAWWRSGAWVTALGLLAGLAAVARLLPPDGRERGLTAQFLGRFHPLLVHVPIGLLLGVPLLEIAGRRPGREGLRQAAGFVLTLATAAVFVTAWDGWLLAWSGGYSGALVVRHLWGGVVLTAVCVATLAARRGGRSDGTLSRVYPLLLAGAIGTVAWTGHEGGALTHGNHFLTERMPARLRGWLGVAMPAAGGAGEAVRGLPGHPRPSDAPVAYAAVIAPVLERSCVPCHRPDKHKGGLRLDTYAQILAGGEDGPVIVAGDPKASELVRRITLPPDDDDYMPSDGRKPLSSDEVHAVEQWIAAGAKAP